MTTAASLNATATIINGHGLNVNQDLLTSISNYQSLKSVNLMSTVFTNAQLDSNVAAAILPVLYQLGNNSVTGGQWLVDLYPDSGNGAVCSGSISRYGNSINGLPSFSRTVVSQASYPLSNGMGGFAYIWTSVYGYAQQMYDTVGSVHMLKDKTYSQSGLGYTGLVDLVTGGIGHRAPLIGQVVSGWGTMYDISNINLIADPYVFGQNLLNHGLGAYGNLSDKLTATGLDVTDLTKVPSSTKITVQQESTQTTTSFVGAVDLPVVVDVTGTNTVTGNNPAVVIAIYKTITGADLDAIISATGFTVQNSNLKTLADFLDFNKVVGVELSTQLSAQDIHNFKDFGTFLQNKVNQLAFASWKDLSDFLLKIEIPKFSNDVTSASSSVLSASTISTISNATGSGSGPFGNPVMLDFFGAMSGTPYTSYYDILINEYGSIVGVVESAMNNLNTSVLTTISQYQANLLLDPNAVVDSSLVSSSVVSVNAALNTAMSAAAASKVTDTNTAYNGILNKVSGEVTSLSKASASVNTPSATGFLMGFGQGIGMYNKSDSIGAGEIVANIITNDAYGDTIRAVIAETVNSTIISGRNDPNPRMASYQSQSQNIPLTTYLSQNK